MALANFTTRLHHGHTESARSYLRPGNIRSVKEQADRGAEQSAKSGLLSKRQSAGETLAECSEFQASGHWSSVDCILGSQLGESEAEVLTGGPYRRPLAWIFASSLKVRAVCLLSPRSVYANGYGKFDTSPLEQRKNNSPVAVNMPFTVWNYNYEIKLLHKSPCRKTNIFNAGGSYVLLAHR